ISIRLKLKNLVKFPNLSLVNQNIKTSKVTWFINGSAAINVPETLVLGSLRVAQAALTVSTTALPTDNPATIPDSSKPDLHHNEHQNKQQHQFKIKANARQSELTLCARPILATKLVA
ncbi:MAG: hypothetical protein ACK559_01045, partial [bacterium]